MSTTRVGAHTKTDLKVHLVWVPKYRKRVLTGQVAIRAHDVSRQVAVEHEIDIEQRWLGLSEQARRFDKWIVFRGQAAARSGWLKYA